MASELTASPAQQIAAGYSADGAAMELGALIVEGGVRPGRVGAAFLWR